MHSARAKRIFIWTFKVIFSFFSEAERERERKDAKVAHFIILSGERGDFAQRRFDCAESSNCFPGSLKI